MADAGANDEQAAAAAFIDLSAELAGQTTLPVLVAIDEANCIIEPTAYHYKREKVEPGQLSIVSALKSLAGGLQNGVVVAAESNSFPAAHRNGEFKQELCGGAGKTLTVADFTPEEYNKTLSFFDDAGVLGGLADAEAGLMMMQTQLNPRQVLRRIILM